MVLCSSSGVYVEKILGRVIFLEPTARSTSMGHQPTDIHPFPGLSYIAAREKSPSSEVRYFKKRPLRHQYMRLVPTDV